MIISTIWVFLVGIYFIIFFLMAHITIHGNPITTVWHLPEIGGLAPDFILTGLDFGDIKLSDYVGKRIILNIFPSVDTGVCSLSVKKFNQHISQLSNTVVICISKDLPLAQKRFCDAETIQNLIMWSDFKNGWFANDYGVLMTSWPLAGLLSRAIVLIDEANTVIYTEQVCEITTQPNYDAVVALLQ